MGIIIYLGAYKLMYILIKNAHFPKNEYTYPSA